MAHPAKNPDRYTFGTREDGSSRAPVHDGTNRSTFVPYTNPSYGSVKRYDEKNYSATALIRDKDGKLHGAPRKGRKGTRTVRKDTSAAPKRKSSAPRMTDLQRYASILGTNSDTSDRM